MFMSCRAACTDYQVSIFVFPRISRYYKQQSSRCAFQNQFQQQKWFGRPPRSEANVSLNRFLSLAWQARGNPRLFAIARASVAQSADRRDGHLPGQDPDGEAVSDLAGNDA